MSVKPLVANELLAFINHAIDTMDEISILQICKSNSKIEEISSAKVLVYELLGKAAQMPTRRRDERGERSLQDIISLLKETDPDHVPTFVAKELHKLPPVTFDHVDVTRLLKDITALKSSLAEMQVRVHVSETTIFELRAELLSIKNNDSVCRSNMYSDNVNTRRGAQNASTGSFESAKFEASPTAAVTHESPRPAPRTVVPVQVTQASMTSTPTRAYATVAAVTPEALAAVAVVTESTASRRRPKPKKKQQKPEGGLQNQRNAIPKVLPVSRTGQTDEEGFIKVERRRKKPSSRNQCGTAVTGPNHLLRPAIPTTQLYVSRLFHSTKAEEVAEYIRVKSNVSVRVVKLEARHNVNFASFVVRVPTDKLETFLWASDIVHHC